MTYDLSVVIPAGRDEEFTSITVKDILKNKRGRTEVIVVADGWWPKPAVEDHMDVRIIHTAEPVGQRAAQNLGVKLSTAKYVMKLDCHCAVEEGFDVKMLDAFKEAGDNVTMVPVMRNMHVFNWRCKHCGLEEYQGPEPAKCKSETCDELPRDFEKKIIWVAKSSPQSTAYRFNKELRFKYFPELKSKQKGDLVESMSLQGSCFMCTRENYWKLNLCDESLGGWGMQGTEVALKTWLSGGRVLCNTRTFYGHLFRTKSGFSFPWGNPAKDQQKSLRTVQDIFLKNGWEKQVKPLSWLLEKFWPELQKVGDKEARWEQKDLDELKKVPFQQGPTKGILFYTTNKLPIKFAKKVQRNLEKMGLPITSTSLKPMKFGKNIHIPLQPGKWAYFTQIIAGLESMDSDIVFMAEHDVMYSKEHFDFTPPAKDKFYYDHAWWKIRHDGFAVHWDAEQVSMLCAYRTHLIDFYRAKLQEILDKGFDRHYEPGSRDKALYEVYNAAVPSLDYRPKDTLTGNKWSPEDFRDKSLCINWQESTLEKLGGSLLAF